MNGGDNTLRNNHVLRPRCTADPPSAVNKAGGPPGEQHSLGNAVLLFRPRGRRGTGEGGEEGTVDEDRGGKKGRGWGWGRRWEREGEGIGGK